MQRLWTPWRMSYIRDGAASGCIFCDLPALGEASDRESLILSRGETAFVLMNKFPYNAGHLMVAAYRHEARYEELTAKEHAEIATLVARCVRALTEAYAPQGFNIGVNLGTAAGAGIAEHMHTHVVPRWNGDTNFMTTLGGTKVLPESLEDTWDRLSPSLT